MLIYNNFSTREEMIVLLGKGSLSTIVRALKKAGYVKKKITSYKEQDPEKVTIYLDKIQGKDKKDLVYIDEKGIAADLVERHVWAKKGTIRKMLIQGKISKSQNIIAAKTNEGIAAIMTFEGSCDRSVF